LRAHAGTEASFCKHGTPMGAWAFMSALKAAFWRWHSRTKPINPMNKMRVESLILSVGGFAAGPSQSLEQPLGAGGTAHHPWAFPPRTFRSKLFGKEGG
jgi:hypothetical protein